VTPDRTAKIRSGIARLRSAYRVLGEVACELLDRGSLGEVDLEAGETAACRSVSKIRMPTSQAAASAPAASCVSVAA
jgi:hypothetical protein